LACELIATGWYFVHGEVQTRLNLLAKNNDDADLAANSKQSRRDAG